MTLRPSSGGRIEVSVADEQDDHTLDLDAWRRLAESVLRALGVVGAAELSLLFVDKSAITALNAQFMSKVGPTDVLSFPIAAEEERGGRDPDGGGAFPPERILHRSGIPYLLGDVVICPEVAFANAPLHAGERGHNGSSDDEIALLIVHAILHLRGMDHEVEAEAEVMEGREDELLNLLYRSERPYVAGGTQ